IEWKDPLRVAGVSSFGFSGTNAHAIISEAPRTAGDPAREGPAFTPRILTLSAHSQDALQKKVADFAVHLRAHPEQDLDDVCFTAATGRAIFPHRIAIPAQDRAELIERLDALTEDR